jgi:6-phospho 3-hexuloisomerase
MTRGARKDALEYITRSINSTIDSIDCALSDEFARALEGSTRIFVYGAGRSGFVARCFTMRLSHLGLRVVRMSIDDTDPPGERDLTIIISGTGETHSSLLYCRLAKDGGSKVVSITENAKSTLAEMSDIVIHLDAPRDGAQRTPPWEQSSRTPASSTSTRSWWT